MSFNGSRWTGLVATWLQGVVNCVYMRNPSSLLFARGPCTARASFGLVPVVRASPCLALLSRVALNTACPHARRMDAVSITGQSSSATLPLLHPALMSNKDPANERVGSGMIPKVCPWYQTKYPPR